MANVLQRRLTADIMSSGVCAEQLHCDAFIRLMHAQGSASQRDMCIREQAAMVSVLLDLLHLCTTDAPYVHACMDRDRRDVVMVHLELTQFGTIFVPSLACRTS